MEGFIMLRVIVLASSLAVTCALPVLPATAAAAAQSTVGSRQCEQTPARQTRRGIFGALGGAALGGLLGSNRVTSTISSFLPVQSLLTDALLNLLDCDEQKKAAKATEDVTEQAESKGVGTTVAWRSESRPGVSGKSTVTAVDGPGESGRRCMTVTDVVIVDGEETTLPKKMCRQPPSKKYAKV
jgi:hypothetical protein